MPRNNNVDTKPRRKMKQHLFAVLNDFCDTTSMHGLGQVSGNTIVIAKSVWFLAVVAAGAGIGFHLAILIQLYLQRPIQESTTTSNQAITFPGITSLFLVLRHFSCHYVLLYGSNVNVKLRTSPTEQKQSPSTLLHRAAADG